MKVLIIDDEKGIIDLYKEQFSLLGINPIECNSSCDALNKAKENRPDVILLDIIMPKLNGLDVLSQLRNDEQTKNIPIYLLTNLPKEASEQKAKELGATGYFVKANFEPKTIAEILQASHK